MMTKKGEKGHLQEIKNGNLSNPKGTFAQREKIGHHQKTTGVLIALISHIRNKIEKLDITRKGIGEGHL